MKGQILMNNSEIKRTAKKFLKETNGMNDFVSIENYLKKKGYKVIFFNTPEGNRELQRFNLTEKARTKSAFTYVGAANIIFIDDNVPNDDKNYLLYHEAGHIELGHIDYERMSTKNNYLMEFETDAFVQLILNPPKPYKKLIPVLVLMITLICTSFIFGAYAGRNYNVPVSNMQNESSPPIEKIIEIDDANEYEKISDTVYVTNTGKKYHRQNCGYLKNSKIEIKRIDAIKQYTPCSRCTP